jgi:PTS system mannose-specific IIB component/fructoselysine and glucoselysine-specific PTS system IIB component
MSLRVGPPVSIDLYRIDDRLIHGQVVVGWGQPLGVGFVVLVDDEVAGSEWEQELYRMGVPPEMEAYFASVEDAARQLPDWQCDARVGILLTGTVEAMHRLVQRCPAIRTVNLGGLHHRPDRRPALRFVYLSSEEAGELREMVSDGIAITAQDVPTARPIPIADVLSAWNSGGSAA